MVIDLLNIIIIYIIMTYYNTSTVFLSLRVCEMILRCMRFCIKCELYKCEKNTLSALNNILYHGVLVL